MAKSTIGRGQFRGKLGGDVFFVSNGEQIVRAYQPIVANPRTKGQVDQRKKAVVAGQLSHLISASIIEGLNGGNRRARRSRFNSNILLNTEVKSYNGTVQAVLDGKKVIFSDGIDCSLIAPASGSAVVDSQVLSFSWNIGAGVVADAVAVIITHYTEYGSGNVLEYEKWSVQTREVKVSDRQVTVNEITDLGLPSQAEGNLEADLWLLPLVTDEEYAAFNVDDINAMQGNFIGNLVPRLSGIARYGKSEWVTYYSGNA